MKTEKAKGHRMPRGSDDPLIVLVWAPCEVCGARVGLVPPGGGLGPGWRWVDEETDEKHVCR